VVNKPFMDHLQWLVTQYHALNPFGRIKKHVVILFCQWLIRAWQCISPAVIVEAFKKCCMSSGLDGTDDTLWNDRKEKGILAVSVRNMKALAVRLDTLQTMKMEKVTLIGKSRISHVLCMNCMKLTAKYFS